MKIDVYDFDKTIYMGDSSIDFFAFCVLHKLTLIKVLPGQILGFLLYKLKLISKLEFKQKFFEFFKSVDNIEKYVDEFWKKNKKKINYEILAYSENKIIIISASPYFLLEKITSEIGCYKLIASDVDKYTGNFLSKNCYGEEKVNRLNLEIKEYTICNFFSDSKSDKYLAKISRKSFLVKGRNIRVWKL